MKDKILSFISGITVGGIIVVCYSYLFADDAQMPGPNPRGANFDVNNMSDEQLENMASRAGITSEELKTRLEAGESLRDIMPARNNSN